ncbi:MAG TPA: MHYT domain-containing protein [Candidatus Angelobacter sp.]|nr:MHYT domain-containing protein [Candidatus Angelobacter sp.]
MLRVIACITRDHDWRLVILAGIICLFACFAALSLLARAATTQGRPRLIWLGATAAVTGSGVWATHFVAMLAFRPNLPMGYDIWLTVLSVFVAMLLTGGGFAVSLANGSRRADQLVGGAIVGFGVFAMHYTGMAALRVPAVVTYDAAFVVASLALGMGFAAPAVRMALAADGLLRRLTAAQLLAAAICGLHFTAMAAVTLDPSPLVPVPEQAMPPEWLAFGVALTTLIILGAGLASSIVDQRVAAVSTREAARLRAAVSELEETKRRLEATTVDLTSALDAADAGDRAKSQFLATMSHELRTPLNAIIGFAEFLGTDLCGPLTPKQRGYVGDIHRAGAHLLALVNDVLDLSQVDARQLALDEDVVELGESIAGAITMVALRAAEVGIDLRSMIAPGLPPVRADERRLRQILLNLLSNAVKFTPKGGAITLSAERRGRDVAITVTDTGIGMAPEHIGIALARFGQVDNRLARRYEGTGLGLPLVKRLVELHGGTLAIASTLGRGTTVTIQLPAERIVDRSKAA